MTSLSLKAKLLSNVFITITPKGGAGKTETAECLEAAITLGGANCALVDVDDGNRGIARRVGKDNVTKLDWSTSITAAPAWVDRHTGEADAMIFDLGAGIDSADLPVMAFLSTVWRMLADQGARITICAVISTNARTSAFVERLDRRFGDLGQVIVICNNQDGSRAFPAELSTLPQPKVQLGQLPSGIQAVRLDRLERLSAVISNPAPNYRIASAIMAKRVFEFAREPAISDLIKVNRVEALLLPSATVPRLRYSITTKLHSTDDVITANARLSAGQETLLRPDLNDSEVLAAAQNFRKLNAAYIKLL